MREASVFRLAGMSLARHTCWSGLLAVCLLTTSFSVQAFEPPLEVAAIQEAQVSGSPMLAVAQAGKRLVAAGLRGVIMFSDDQGASWTQATVPVSVDLVALAFPSAEKGWAVGHGGVVLHSEDAGRSWHKQLDGLQALQLARDFYADNPEGLAEAESYLLKEQALAVGNETQPFLDVFFSDARTGYVVGTFNRIFMTEDGGKHWRPLMHITDNPREWHFYAVSGEAGQLYLSGEQGHVWRLDRQSGRFVEANTPYNGTLFGVLAGGTEQEVYAYGMRGSFFFSDDQGASWQRTALPFTSNVIRVMRLERERLLLVAQGGELALSEDAGRSFSLIPATAGMPYFAATLLQDSRLALAGVLGVRLASF